MSRRGNKMPGESHQQASGLSRRTNEDWILAGMSAPKRSRNHDYGEAAILKYRSDEDSCSDYDSSCHSDEERPFTQWPSVIVSPYAETKVEQTNQLSYGNALAHPARRRDEDESMVSETAYWSAPRQHLTSASEVQQETEVSSTLNDDPSRHDEETSPPSPPEEDKEKFKYLYVLVEAAAGIRQQEQERETREVERRKKEEEKEEDESKEEEEEEKEEEEEEMEESKAMDS